MGNPHPNKSAGPHVSLVAGVSTLTGYRLVHHFGAAYDDSPDADAATWATVKAAAQQSFAAFDSAAAAEWGSWWTSWSQADREGWHVAVKAA